MQKSNSVIVVIMAIVSLSFFSTCREKVPIKELAEARKGISRAREVKADKYAPDELKGAEEKIYESHDFIMKEDVKKSTAAAEESSRLSLMAYNKSLPLLAKDTIAVAENSLGEAGEAYAEQLAGSEFREAEEYLVKANDLFQDKKYYESYVAAAEADKKAKLARNIALSKKDILSDSIAEVKNILEEAEKYGAKKYTPEKMQLAEENLDIAAASLESQELKKGFSAIEVAKINADDAYLTALGKFAEGRYGLAKKLVGQAEKSTKAAGNEDGINAAREALEIAGYNLKEEKFRESIDASDEAIRLASGVLGIVVSEDGTYAVREDTDEKSDSSGDESADYFLYTVQYRDQYKDCLWYIARKYYRNGRKWKKIFEANREKINNPNLIFPGQVLKVPKQ